MEEDEVYRDENGRALLTPEALAATLRPFFMQASTPENWARLEAKIQKRLDARPHRRRVVLLVSADEKNFQVQPLIVVHGIPWDDARLRLAAGVAAREMGRELLALWDDEEGRLIDWNEDWLRAGRFATIRLND